MTRLQVLLARIRGIFRSRRAEQELATEIDTHLDLLAAEHERQGATPGAARMAARRDFGGAEQVKESYRERRGLPLIDSLTQDTRAAGRTLRRSPGFTAVAVAILAVGTGVNAAVFTVVNGALFSGLPQLDPDNRIVFIQARQRVSYPDFEDWRSAARSFDGPMALFLNGGARIRIADRWSVAETYDVTQLSADAFRVLGRAPLLGRDFLPSDELPGAAPVVILSYHLWESRYGRDPSIIGQDIRINGTAASWGAVDMQRSAPATVIGVMPQGVRFPLYRVDLWLPLVPTPGLMFPTIAGLRDRNVRRFDFAFARLANGVGLAAARAEISAIGQRLEQAYPDSNRGVAPTVRYFREAFQGPQALTLYGSLWAAVGLLLLIASANLANLLLAKAIGRSHEMTIRIALGAGRRRVVQQLLFEGLALAAMGGALGWLLAESAVRLYIALGSAPNSYVRWQYALDYRVLGYHVGLCLATGVLVSIAPAIRLARSNLNGLLKGGGRGSIGGRQGVQFSHVLVTIQVALAVMLLTAAGLMLRTLGSITTADPGVRTEDVLTAPVGLPAGKYQTPSAQLAVIDQLLTAVEVMPGVETAAMATATPGGGTGMVTPLPRSYEHQGDGDAGAKHTSSTVVVSPAYFDAVGASVLRGRNFTRTDGASTLPVAIVNEAFAREAWPGSDPIGRQVRPAGSTGSWLTVVGIASNILQDDWTGQEFKPAVYRPLQQQPAAGFFVLARTRVPPHTLAMVLRRAVEGVDSDLLVGPGGDAWALSLDERIRLNSWDNAVNGYLFLTLAGLALALTAVGLAAVVAHAVSRRIPEFGVRMALGAARRDILSLVLRQSAWPVMGGLAMGLAGSAAAAPILRSQLVGVSPSDPLSFAASSLALLIAATIGCLLPARRALRVDPAVALRHE